MLLHAGSDANACDTMLRSPLHAAVSVLSQRNSSRVQAPSVASCAALIGAGADTSMADAAGDTPLHLAVKHAVPETIIMLCTSEQAVNAANSEGMTPLVCLIERIRRERTRTPEAHFTGALSALIQAGADPGKILKGFGTTALHRAVMMDKPEILNTMLVCDVALKDIRDGMDRTVAHLAASSGATECLSIILQSDPSLVACVDSQKLTPLHLAAARNHLDCVQRQTLLDHGASPLTLASSGLSAIQMTQHDSCRSLMQNAVNEKHVGGEHPSSFQPNMERSGGLLDSQIASQTVDECSDARETPGKAGDDSVSSDSSWDMVQSTSSLTTPPSVDLDAPINGTTSETVTMDDLPQMTTCNDAETNRSPLPTVASTQLLMRDAPMTDTLVPVGKKQIPPVEILRVNCGQVAAINLNRRSVRFSSCGSAPAVQASRVWPIAFAGGCRRCVLDFSWVQAK